MNILIVGYGRMGHMVEDICEQRGHTVIGRIDPSGSGDYKNLREAPLEKAEGAIEFALPEGVDENAALYAQNGIAAVVGTTGWTEKKNTIEEIVQKHNGSYLYGSNFSVGAHLFMKLTETAAALLNAVPGYDIMVHEYHHNKKKDSPSGTALTTAEKILKHYDKKSAIVTDALQREIAPEELHVSSTRGGNIPGIHTVTLDSIADSIDIRHSARSREGFALGSVLALEWLNGKTGFFPVESFIEEMFSGVEQ